MAAYERGKVHATNERSKEGMMRDFSFHSRGKNIVANVNGLKDDTIHQTKRKEDPFSSFGPFVFFFNCFSSPLPSSSSLTG
ncbi:hypothetical protein P8452_72498 [Trifolium repens]|nr:hypothetical protein P8452_72498 [Trifolium repens]